MAAFSAFTWLLKRKHEDRKHAFHLPPGTACLPRRGWMCRGNVLFLVCPWCPQLLAGLANLDLQHGGHPSHPHVEFSVFFWTMVLRGCAQAEARWSRACQLWVRGSPWVKVHQAAFPDTQLLQFDSGFSLWTKLALYLPWTVCSPFPEPWCELI